VCVSKTNTDDELSHMKSDPVFSSYLGIDWSGAKAKHHAGLQLAIAKPGKAVPRRMCPPVGRYWSRCQVLELLIEHADAATGKLPVLAGIDFAFAHPFRSKQSTDLRVDVAEEVDGEGYFPCAEDSPKTATELWALVEKVNHNQPDLYGGTMFRHPKWGEYYLAPPNYKARYYKSCRRLTEIASRAAGRSPSPTFKAVGADNVSTGSLAGMRLLHQLKKHLGERLSIWPFDDIVDGKTDLVLVEIFPSLYFYRLGMVSAKKAAANSAFINRALAAYDSDGVKPGFTPMGNDADEADAIIAAAALRYFSIASGFTLPAAAMAIARREGWIFGVPYDAFG
jgi:hypothetical protein